MNNSNIPQMPPALHQALDRYRRRRKIVRVLCGLFITLGVLLGSVGIAVAADRLFRTASSVRSIFLLAISAASLFTLARWLVWPAVQRMGDRDAALRLGRKFPQMEEDLVSGVELSVNGGTQLGVSHALIASALAQIDDRTQKVDYRAAVSIRPLAEAAVVFIVVAAVLQAAFFFQREAVENALRRLFRPHDNIPYFSYTNLSVMPGTAVVRTGTEAEMIVAATGRHVKTGRLDVTTGTESVKHRLEFQNDTARWPTGPLFADLSYRVSAGDAETDWFHLRVVPPPSLRVKSAVLRDPDYAGAQQRTIPEIQGALEIVAGTRVTLRAEAVRRGDDPQFKSAGRLQFRDNTWPMADKGPNLLEVPEFVPVESGDVVIKLKDGYGLDNASPETFFIKVVPDAVPRVAIHIPNHDLMCMPEEEFPVEASAEDEFGIRSLNLTFRVTRAVKAGDEEHPAPDAWQTRLLKEGGTTLRSLREKTTVQLADFNLQPGDLLEYRAEASDYADEAALRVGQSQILRVLAISHEEHLQQVLQQLMQVEMEMIRQSALQAQQAQKAEELAKAAQKGAVSSEARQAEQRERQRVRETEDLSKQVDDLIAQLLRNPITPESTLVDMDQLSKATQSVAENPMSKAANSFGQAAEGNPSEQQPSLNEAQESAKKAAQQMEELARLAERIRRQTILQRLAAEAELLAAREREVGKSSLGLGVKLAGMTREQLPPGDRALLDHVTALQGSVQTGSVKLRDEILKAMEQLASSNLGAAMNAEEAAGKMETDRVSERAAAVARQMAKGVVFSQAPEEEAIAKSLTGVAEILRRSTETDNIAKMLEEFIRRQTEINANIGDAIKKTLKAQTPLKLSESQSSLQRDVSEQAAAIHWLAQESGMFKSETADTLDEAAKEMTAGASDLIATALPEGLVHGERALELLKGAREKFEQEQQQMQGQQQKQSAELMLLIQRILIGQKRVNRQTTTADARPDKTAPDFTQGMVELSKTQGYLRQETGRLQRKLARQPQAAEFAGEIGSKMDASRLALEAHDTGSETRVVQKEIALMLEKFLKDQQAGGGGGGSAAAMSQMMGSPGSKPGGYTGGTNADVEPSPLEAVRSRDWNKSRSRFDEKLGTSAEENFPAEYRDLLNAYFDRLRKEPPK